MVAEMELSNCNARRMDTGHAVIFLSKSVWVDSGGLGLGLVCRQLMIDLCASVAVFKVSEWYLPKQNPEVESEFDQL